MEAPTIGTTINVLVIAAYSIGAAWRGYHRRKAHWSTESWRGLGATVFVGSARLGFALFFSAAVGDHPAAWVGAPGSSTRGYWVVISLGSLVGGTLLAGGALAWFAVGDPVKPFRFFGRLVAVLLPRYRPRARLGKHGADSA